jgi:TolB-like protein/Tfp pilus assembly protein PilF
VDQKSVAVLAFANLSDDKGNDYFSDGISEALVNVLAKVPGLKITARTSSFFFKGKNLPVPEIAQELNVAYVVEGSVRKAGDRVRITAQLINAADGFNVWSDTFTRDLKDIFAVQDEIAGRIAQNLQLQMGAPRATRAVDPEAHRLVLEGRHFWNLRATEGFARAEAAFTKAIELDPQFAEAHAGQADNFQIRAQYKMLDGVGSEAADQERAWTEGQIAFRLDPALPETDAALAYLLHNQGKLAEAEVYYEKAFALNPNYAIAHLWHGQWLDSYGRLDAASEENRLACELDPLGFIILDRYAEHLVLAHRFEEALAVNERAVALRTDIWMPNRGERALILFALGRNKEAVTAARSVRQNPANWPRWTADADAVWVLRACGLVQEADGYTAELLRTLPEKSCVRGFVLAHAGRLDEATPYFERAPVLVRQTLFWEQTLDPWREDPCFQQLLVKLDCAQEYKVACETPARMLKEQEAKK